ncbi:MAG: class I SAM-dependent methyltransferase [Acidobacteriota bacterium]
MSFETQFGLSEAAYRAFRPAYPASLFQQIIDSLSPPHRRAVDLGAGTGLSTLHLCQWFDEVIAVEPDSEMAANLYRLSSKIEVHHHGAEAHEEEAGSVDLVTSGNAFYWMNGEVVAAKVGQWLRAQGVFAVCRYGFPQAPPAIQSVLENELREHWNSFRHPRLIDEAYSLRIIQANPIFRRVRGVEIANVVLLSAEQLAGFLASTSYVSAYLRTIVDPVAYVSNLEAEFKDLSGLSHFPVDFSVELILAST